MEDTPPSLLFGVGTPIGSPIRVPGGGPSEAVIARASSSSFSRLPVIPPRHPDGPGGGLTLESEEKRVNHIPEDAEFYCFMYPLDGVPPRRPPRRTVERLEPELLGVVYSQTGALLISGFVGCINHTRPSRPPNSKQHPLFLYLGFSPRFPLLCTTTVVSQV